MCLKKYFNQQSKLNLDYKLEFDMFQVVRTAEACANTIATTLAPSMVIRVLAPLIQTGEYPLNLAAVKMLTRLVETCGRDPVYDFLPDLMPGLIQVSMQCATTWGRLSCF